MTLIHHLRVHVGMDLCGGSVMWLRGLPSAVPFAVAYDACPQGEWLLWLAARVGVNHKAIVRAACAVAQVSIDAHWRGGPEPQVAIDTAIAWTLGEATLTEVRKAAAAATTIAAIYAADYEDAAALSAGAAAAAASAVEHEATAYVAAAYGATATTYAADVLTDVVLRKAQLRNARIVRQHITLDLWPASLRCIVENQ